MQIMKMLFNFLCHNHLFSNMSNNMRSFETLIRSVFTFCLIVNQRKWRCQSAVLHPSLQGSFHGLRMKNREQCVQPLLIWLHDYKSIDTYWGEIVLILPSSRIRDHTECLEIDCYCNTGCRHGTLMLRVAQKTCFGVKLFFLVSTVMLESVYIELYDCVLWMSNVSAHYLVVCVWQGRASFLARRFRLFHLLHLDLHLLDHPLRHRKPGHVVHQQTRVIPAQTINTEINVDPRRARGAAPSGLKYFTPLKMWTIL